MGLSHTLRGIADTGRISVPTFMESLLGKLDAAACDERLGWWSQKLLRDAGVDLDVQGQAHLGEGQEPFIVMSNHQSLYDIPVLFCSIPGRLRMVAKAELFKVPIWGQAMLAAGFIRIDRADRDKAVESLRAGSSMLERGTRIWIAPEGTRSPTGIVGPFKSGGFRMALESHTRILPVAIDGTRRILPAKGVVVHTGQKVRVTILPPFDPDRYGMERRKALMNDVRQAIVVALGQAEEPPLRPEATQEH